MGRGPAVEPCTDGADRMNWEHLVRPALVGLEPYDPGAAVSHLHELKEVHGLDELIKLNWNENLFGPFPGALDIGRPASGGNPWQRIPLLVAVFRSSDLPLVATGCARGAP